MKKKAAKRKSKRKAAKESSCVFATRQAWGPLPYPHLTAACALSVLSAAGEWAGEKLMLLREVQGSLSPENPAGGWMQRWHKPSAGYGPRLEAETAPPSFLPSLPPCPCPSPPSPYLEVPLEAAGRALVLRRRVQRRSGRGRAAVRSRVPGADGLRPARGLRPRRGAPEAPVEPGASGREAAAVRPGPVAVGRRVVGASVAPRRGRQGPSAGGRAPDAAARVGSCRCAESRPVHGRDTPGMAAGAEPVQWRRRRVRSFPFPRLFPAGRPAGSGL